MRRVPVDLALTQLAAEEPRPSRLVDLRVFGSPRESAET
jgi:hypothetical protein